MAIGPGSRLGPYEVTALIGEGGMGKVWRAHHIALNRDDALKVLPEAFVSDPDRLARFRREAQVLASLNHSNIAHVYGLEQADGAQALVMELVEGPTFADRIAQGPIPLDEALPIAQQIAEALEAAHEQGIIHRDLKPANIKLRPDGTVKVLDFGLAKALDRGVAAIDAAQSPTITSPALMTGVGVLLGTAAYMSPEQAKGKPADKRSDIWAFGCVLYEMLTGQPAFEGESAAEILGAVLKTEPDWKRLPANVPPSVRTLLRLCLQKNPRNRRSDASDVRIDIEQALTEPENAGSSVGIRARSAWRLAWLTTGVMTLAFALIAVVHFRETPPAEALEMRLEITTPATSSPLDFTLSPDGRSLAFVASGDGPQRLWIRQLDQADARPLPGTEDAAFPFWSADGRSIGFFATGRLKRIDIASGQLQVLATAGTGRGGAWNSDDTILFAATSGGSLFHIPASGGEPVPATRVKPNQSDHRFPAFLPDGKHFLFYVQGDLEIQGIYLGSLDGGEPKRLTAADSAGAYLTPNRIVFVRQGALITRQLDLAREELVGNPETLADSVGLNAVFRGGFSVSTDGRIAYRAGEASRTRLAWY